ncbi:MAG: hypothetical protein IKX56_05880 [Muribaculaceae bacterium]|nr:hypothetical protein [Muribaculaceae bacterium]
MYLIYVEWDWDDFYDDDDQYDPDDDPSDYGPGDQLTDEIVSIIDGVIEDWDDYEITYDWEDSSTIVVALHVDYDFDEDDEEY